MIVGGRREDRQRFAAAEEDRRGIRSSSRLRLDAAAWPFVRPTRAHLPLAAPRLLRVDDLERGCPNRQTAGTRLILTQLTYTLQKWIDLLRPGGRLLLVEGSWTTGAGLTAEETVALVEATGREAALRRMPEPVLWGREITDDRYLVVSTGLDM